MAPRRLLIISALLLLLSASACEDRRADKAYVRGDYEKARTDIEFLAHGGEPRAQYDLGLMYDQGQGVQPDVVQAYYWISLSANRGNVHARDARDYVSEKMSTEQLVTAKRLIQ